jgi:hypothetical protein
MESQSLSGMSLPLARLRNFDASRQCLSLGETLMRQVADPFGLGLLLCNRAECEWLAGQGGAAHAACAQAHEVMSASGAGPTSELGKAIKRVTAMLAAAD